MNKCSCGRDGKWSFAIVWDYTHRIDKDCCEDCIRSELSAIAKERQKMVTLLEIKKIDE